VNAAAAVVVLGRAGLEREAVATLLRSGGSDVIDLDRLAAADDATIVAVLVEPGEHDWATAVRLDARVVVVLDRPPGDDRLLRLLESGADAVLHADVDVAGLLGAVRAVGEGDAHLAPSQAKVVLERLRNGNERRRQVPRLTVRESEILAAILEGATVRATADALGVAEKTVQNLQSRLFRKLGARNRAQAVTIAHELGLGPRVR
jgi:DNA-binding NarL/FixJ family response regulator